jgi:hypothetical protein
MVQLTARIHSGLRRLETDFRMLAVAERLRDRRAAPAKENSAFAFEFIEIAISIAQLKLAQISGYEIWPIFCCDNIHRHRSLLAIPGQR